MHHVLTVGRAFRHPGLHDHPAGGPVRRRTLLGVALASVGTMPTGREARAFAVENVRMAFEPGPEREGVVPWTVLADVTSPDGRDVAFAPAIEALGGTEVRLEGFMMPFEPAPLQERFLLTAYAAHCPFCMPGGLPSMVEVTSREPVPLVAYPSRLTMRGRLELRRDPGDYDLLYRMLDATPAA